jgi:hypothetical protein
MGMGANRPEIVTDKNGNQAFFKSKKKNMKVLKN